MIDLLYFYTNDGRVKDLLYFIDDFLPTWM